MNAIIGMTTLAKAKREDPKRLEDCLQKITYSSKHLLKLINILGNAVKFTPSGGSVEFLAEELPEAGQKGHVSYLFTVRDTGIGMSEDFLKYVFDPFTRSSMAARVEGSGLGLSITKGLVDLMGGEITVESTPGQGTAFRVRLECEAAPEDIQMPEWTLMWQSLWTCPGF